MLWYVLFNQGDCSKLMKPGILVLMACNDTQGSMSQPHRLVVTGPPVNGVPQYHVDFNSVISDPLKQVSITADYSNSQEYFTDEGLGNPNATGQTLNKRGFFSRFSDWANSIRKINTDKSVLISVPLSKRFRLLDKTVAGGSCSGSVSSFGSASITADVTASIEVHGVFGVRVQGTLFPLDLTGAS